MPKTLPAIASGWWMTRIEAADSTMKAATAPDTAITGNALPAGWTRTMAPTCPKAVLIRRASSAIKSGPAGNGGLRPIRPCWRSLRSAAARWAEVSPGNR